MKLEIEITRNKDTGYDFIGVVTLDGIECFHVAKWSNDILDTAVRDDVIDEMDYFIHAAPSFYPRQANEVKGKKVIFNGKLVTVLDFNIPRGLCALSTEDGVQDVEVHSPEIDWNLLT